jgi:hypothetical protein
MPLFKIPHYLIGRLVGWEDIMIYIMFPSLYHENQACSNPANKHLQQWTDEILLPAIYDNLPSISKQRLPISYEHSKYAGLAAGVEQRVRGIDSHVHRVQQLRYLLKSKALDNIWTPVLSRIKQPGLRHFQGVRLFAESIRKLEQHLEEKPKELSDLYLGVLDEFD